MNLYEINQALARYQMDFDPETGEWLNEDELNELELAKDEKVENICLLIKNKKAEIEAFKAEEKNLAERRGSLEKEVKRLEGYVGGSLNGEEFSTTRVKVTWRKSEAVIIDDDRLVPDELCDNTIVRKPNKKAIKMRLKQAEAKGETIAWATLEERNNMTIK